MPVFKGARQLLKCLELLTRRPRQREAPLPVGRARSGVSAQGIPLLCLKRPNYGGALADGLVRYLKEAEPRRIPHVLYRYPQPGGTDLEVLSAALTKIARDLASGSNAAGGRIRFTRFGLVLWLIRQDLGADLDPHAVLRRRLRERDLSRTRSVSVFSNELQEFLDAPVARWVKWALFLHPLWFLLRLSGALPGVGQEYRWLVHQPYLEPQQSGSVLGFAARLTTDLRQSEDPFEVQLLLVEAFLSDVARAYRRSPWRSQGARRTAYPVVLLDGADDGNGGFALLDLVKEARSESHHSFDPVVFVGLTDSFPKDATSGDPTRPSVVQWSASEAMDGYEAWCRSLTGRSHPVISWYLPIVVPAPEPRPAPGSDESAEQQYATLWNSANDARRFEVEPAPLWAQRVVAPTAAVLVAAGALGAGIVVGPPWPKPPLVTSDPTSLNEQPAATATPTASPVALENCLKNEKKKHFLQGLASAQGTKECIGIADQMGIFAKSTTIYKLDEVYKKQNRRADELAQESPERKVVYLVYVSSFEQPKSADLLSQKFELAGFLGAQRDQNEDRSGRHQPIVKILLGNAGVNMLQQQALVKQLQNALDVKVNIGAVVGLDHSSAPSKALIQGLDAIRMPVVSATLTAEDMGGGTSVYFHAAPLNSVQAEKIAEYARLWASDSSAPNEVAVVCPADSGNLWSQTLRDGLRKEFEAMGWGLTVYPFEPDEPESTDGQADPAACGSAEPMRDVEELPAELAKNPNRLVIFAGRAHSFELFLKNMPAKLDVIAGDDVSSYVALRDNNPYSDKHVFAYVSLAYEGDRKTPVAPAYARYAKLEGMDKIDAGIDGHAALAQKAAKAVLQAAGAALKDGAEPDAAGILEKLTHQAPDRQVTPHPAQGAECSICILQVDHYAVRRHPLVP